MIDYVLDAIVSGIGTVVAIFRKKRHAEAHKG